MRVGNLTIKSIKSTADLKGAKRRNKDFERYFFNGKIIAFLKNNGKLRLGFISDYWIFSWTQFLES